MQNRNITFDGQPIYLLGERACGIRGFNNVQNFYIIQKQCLESGTLFEDPEFPLTGRFVRPSDICHNPKFLINKSSSFDVQRRNLSDCWFLSAVASLTLNEKLFGRVVCDENSFDHNYTGIFHFRFWQYTRWVDVVIDDRLPANGNELINLHSTQRNEFWLPLLEKAYAKLYGSYEALHAGISCEAFEDFTGGVSEIYNLKSAPGNLYEVMEVAFRKHTMMTCLKNDGLNAAAEGLIRITAYSITNVKTVEVTNYDEKIQLLQVRNPWANNTEWNDDLNDCWNQLSEDEKQQKGLTVDQEGEFWISYQNFIKHFDRLDLCTLSPSSLEIDKDIIKWDISLCEGQWMKDFSAGGCSHNEETFHLNPQYSITLKSSNDDEEEVCPVVITLIQKNRRIREAIPPQFLVIGFSIYRVSEEQLQRKPLKREFFEITRRYQASRFTNSRRVTDHYNLKAGNYLIIPSTFDPNEECEFILRVYSDRKHKVKVHDIDLEIIEVIPKAIAVQEVENLYGVDANQQIGWSELKTILDSTIPEDVQQSGNSESFSRENCRSLIAVMGIDFSRKVKFEEFKKFYNYYELWKFAFKTFDKDKNHQLNPLEFHDALESIGYSFGARIIYSLIYEYGNEFNKVSYESFIMCAAKVKGLIDVFKKKNENQEKCSVEEWIMVTLMP